VDRESAYEKLKGRAASAPTAPTGGGTVSGSQPGARPGAEAPQESGGMMGGLNDILFGTTGPRGGKHDGIVQTLGKSAARTIGSSVGREIIRGVLGSLFGGSGGKRR
jgi:hypothetical protein